jgi:hypothetical protein
MTRVSLEPMPNTYQWYWRQDDQSYVAVHGGRGSQPQYPGAPLMFLDVRDLPTLRDEIDRVLANVGAGQLAMEVAS